MKVSIKRKNIVPIFGSVFISAIGGWIFQVVLLIYLFNKTESGTVVSLFILSSALPALILSPIVVRFITNISDRSVMISADIIRMLLVIALIFARDEFVIIFIISALLSLFGVAFRSAYIKKVTRLYKEDERRKVNAVLNSGIHIAMGLGAMFGGLLLSHMNLSFCLLVNAVTYLLSSFFIFHIDESKDIYTTKNSEGNVNFNHSFNEIKSNYMLSSILLFGISWGVVGGAFNILFPVIFMFNGQNNHLLTVFYVVQAFSMLIGSIVVYFLKFRDSSFGLFKVFVVAYFLQAVCFSAALFINNIYVCFITIAAMRLFGGLIIPLDTTLIQNNSSEKSLAMIYNIHNLTYNMFYQLTVLVTGAMIDTMQLSHVKLIAAFSGGILISIVCIASFVVNSRCETNEKSLRNVVK